MGGNRTSIDASKSHNCDDQGGIDAYAPKQVTRCPDALTGYLSPISYQDVLRISIV